MEKYLIQDDITVFGVQVPNFPVGVGAAFEKLVQTLPGGLNRPYFGICSVQDGKLLYYATTAETFPGEAALYNYEIRNVEKGEYMMEPIKDWKDKTDCIKDVFTRLVKQPDVDLEKPCVEWYKNDDEMLCMLRTKSNN